MVMLLDVAICGHKANKKPAQTLTEMGDKDDPQLEVHQLPRCSMYGIFTYILVIFGVNVAKYSIHGAFGLGHYTTF